MPRPFIIHNNDAWDKSPSCPLHHKDNTGIRKIRVNLLIISNREADFNRKLLRIRPFARRLLRIFRHEIKPFRSCMNKVKPFSGR